jgi:hypothetical protein
MSGGKLGNQDVTFGDGLPPHGRQPTQPDEEKCASSDSLPLGELAVLQVHNTYAKH